MSHPAPSQIYTGRIIVRLHPQITDQMVRAFPERRALELGEASRALESRALGPAEPGRLLDTRALLDLLRELGDPPTARVVHRWTLAETAARETRALANPGYRSLNSYFSIDLRGRTLPEVMEAAAKLRQVPGVETAVMEPIPVGATITPDKFTEHGGISKDLNVDEVGKGQGYVSGDHTKGSVRSGVNAYSAWQAGFDGTGVKMVILEQGWRFDHPDLPMGIHLLDQGEKMNNNEKERWHGTMTLGVIAAIDHPGKGMGIVGIAPSVTIPGVASCDYKPQPNTLVIQPLQDTREIADAITVAIDFLRPGDVLLLEQQVNERPLEKMELWGNAIYLAVSEGITVIEPAGNAKTANQYDLDQDDWAPEGEILRSLDRRNPSFFESGAIMVGACEAVPHANNLHNRLSTAWYGSRIDCYAWGEHVLTTACWGMRLGLGESTMIQRCNDGPPEELYDWYSGTSAASAIIAGTIALIHQMHMRARDKAASPEAIRTIVRSLALGTPIGNISSNTSVMPDLAKIEESLILDS